MAEQDTLLYFDARGRGESIRLMYALANQPLVDRRINDFKEWQTKLKGEQPLGQLPVFKCKEGTLVLSAVIAKYVAKKFDYLGASAWEEALNDLIISICTECHDEIGRRIYHWKVFKYSPEPDNSDKLIEEVKEKVVQKLAYIQSLAEERGRRFIIGDTIMAADVWVYCLLEYASPIFKDLPKLTPWLETFMERFTSDDRVKAYLSQRPASHVGL